MTGAPCLTGRRPTIREAPAPAARMYDLDYFRSKAAKANQSLLVSPNDGHAWNWAPEPFVWPRFSVSFVTSGLADVFYVFPSGLAQPLPDLNWIWHSEAPLLRSARRYSPFYQGSARDVLRACTRLGVDPETVRAVAAEDIHGTCVFVPGPSFPEDKRDWRMVQARSIW